MLKVIRFILGVINALLTPLAGPYRAVAYKVDAFGGVGHGVLTWAGIAVVYPAYFYIWDDPEMRSGFLWSWAALTLMAWITMLARWCSVHPRLDPCEGHCRLGRWEPVLALALSAAAHSAGDTGGFFLAGYACSATQIGLVRLRRRFGAWAHEDTWRIQRPFRAAAKLAYDFSWMIPPAASRLRSIAWRLADLTERLGRFVLSISLKMLRWMFARPAPQPIQASQGVIIIGGPSPSLGQGLAKGAFIHVLIGLVTGSMLLKVALIPIAFLLRSAGFEVHMPHSFGEYLGGKAEAARSIFLEKKDDLGDRIEEQRERISEGFRRKKGELREEAEEAKDRLMDKGEELEGKAAGHVRKKIIGF